MRTIVIGAKYFSRTEEYRDAIAAAGTVTEYIVLGVPTDIVVENLAATAGVPMRRHNHADAASLTAAISRAGQAVVVWDGQDETVRTIINAVQSAGLPMHLEIKMPLNYDLPAARPTPVGRE